MSRKRYCLWLKSSRGDLACIFLDLTALEDDRRREIRLAIACRDYQWYVDIGISVSDLTRRRLRVVDIFEVKVAGSCSANVLVRG